VQAREPKTPFNSRGVSVPVGPAGVCEIARFRIDPQNIIRATSVVSPDAVPPELLKHHAGVGLPLAAIPAPLPGSEPLLAMVRECRNTGHTAVLTWESVVRPGEQRGARVWPVPQCRGWVWLAVDHLSDIPTRKEPRVDAKTVAARALGLLASLAFGWACAR
jgi:hypothetical protein